MNENKPLIKPTDEAIGEVGEQMAARVAAILADVSVSEAIERAVAKLSPCRWVNSPISINGVAIEIREAMPSEGEHVVSPWMLRGSREIHIPKNYPSFFSELDIVDPGIEGDGNEEHVP